jgi:hypothetical protein
LRRQVAAFERAWNYDASYLRALIDADPLAMLAFGKLQGIVDYRRDMPPAVYAAAGVIAVMQGIADRARSWGSIWRSRAELIRRCCARS